MYVALDEFRARGTAERGSGEAPEKPVEND